MNLTPFQVKVAALSDEGLATAAVTYLDEAPDALQDAEDEDLSYRIVVLTAYKDRIPAADLESVERALKRINHQRQTREPHRILGGIVPPLVEEVTVRTVSKTPTNEPITRTRKLELLQHYLAEGQKLTSGKPQPLSFVVKPGDDRTPLARWKDDVRETLALVEAPDWKVLVDANGERRSELAVGLECLRALKGRVQRRAPLGLEDDARAALVLRSTLLIWGDHLIDLSNGAGHVDVEYDAADYESFVASVLPQCLASARAYLGPKGVVPTSTLNATIALVEARLDADSFMPSSNPEVWHAGWALMALAWWLADSLGDPLTISYGRTCCSLAEARASRFQFLAEGGVTCPRCRGEPDLHRGDEHHRVQLPSHLWLCSACDIAGYFPVNPSPQSVWAQRTEERADRAEGLEVDVVAAPELAAPDLSWMCDPALSRIANDDFEEMKVCLHFGAYKAALLLAGSVCESMLLDMLERNAVIAKTYVKKPDDFPDRASLEQLVAAATSEGLVTGTALHLAPAVKNYRDLIHPHRVRVGDIKVDLHTAKLLAQAAVIIARDLGDAVADGRADRFEKKK